MTKKHTYWIILLCLLLSLGSYFFFKYRGEIANLRENNIQLDITNSQLKEVIDYYERERVLAWETIDSIDLEVFKLELELEDKEYIIAELRDSLNNTPEAIDTIPKEESYEYLQVRYPSEEEKEFQFSGAQVKGIHTDVVTGDIYENLYVETSLAKDLLVIKVDKLEDRQDVLDKIIEDYEAENAYLIDYNSCLQEDNIKKRVQRNTAIIVAVLEAIGVALLIAL